MKTAAALLLCGLAWLLVPVAAAEAATLSGVVKAQLVGQEAKAQAGATVTVLERESGASVASTTTNASGEYSVTAPSGTFDVRYDPPPQSAASSTVVKNVDLSTNAVVNVVLIAAEGVRFHGTVRTAAGDPVPGLRLYFDSSSPEVAAETDSEGGFSAVLSPGTYRFVIEYLGPARPGIPAGFWEWDLSSLTLEEDRSAELVLPETAQLTLHVTGSEGAPLPEAQIDIGPLSRQQDLGGLGTGYLVQDEFSRKTDAEGNVHTTVFQGWAGHGTVRPPQSSGYGNTAFTIPAVEGDTTMVLNLGAGGGASEDVEAPRVEGLSVEPAEVNTTVAPQTVTVYAHIIDDFTGFTSGSITFTSPSGEQATTGYEFNRVNGDAQNGGYEIPVTFEAGSESGPWYVTAIRVADAAGNERLMEPEEMEERGFSRRVIVQNGEGGEDIQAPKLNELLIEPGEVDTAASAQTVTLFAHITDDLSGFKSGSVVFTSPSGNQQAAGYEFKRVAGDARGGTYEIPVTFEQFSENGTWQIAVIRLTDETGNERVMEPQEIEELGLSHTVIVSGEPVEPRDTEPPHLENLSIEPTSIDTSATKQPVLVTATVSDNLSGFEAGSLAFISPNGEQLVEGGEFEPVGGGAEGVYRSVITFAQGSEPGNWEIAKVRLRDRAGNEVSISGAEVEEAGLPHTVTVQRVSLGSSVNPSVYGQNVTFTAQVSGNAGSAPLGTVTFTEGSATLGVVNLNGEGVATLSTTQLGAGEHQITAVYSGDSSHPAGESAPLTQVVEKAATTVTLASSLNPAPFRAQGSLEATVAAVAPGAGTPTGTVTFREGETDLEVVPLVGGSASLQLKSLPAGEHHITALYSGDSSFKPSVSGLFVQTITKAATELTLKSSKNPARQGSSGTIKATVKSPPGSGTPTGTVTFREGATVLATIPLANKTASYPLKSLPVGTHEITAVYGGSEEYEASEGSIVQVITP